jgi:outer membrane protein
MIIFLSLMNLSFAGVPDGLKQIHSMAQAQSELIEVAKSREEQALERKNRARGTLFPQLTGRYSFTEIDPLPGEPSPFRRRNQYSALINLTQPVYRGDAISAFSFARLDIDLQKRLKEQEGLSLWMDVGDTYYNLWRSKVDLENIRQLRGFSDERVKELKERVRVGRSRKGELLQAQAQLSAVEADLTQAENMVRSLEERIEFLAGKKIDPQFGALPLTPERTPPLGEYIQKISQRPDIKARSQEVLMADKMIDIARAGHQPTLDFSANGYLLRTGIVEDSQWDVGVNLSVPIFQGGSVVAQTREATERKREANLMLERAKREAERDIKILWLNAQAVEKMLSDLKAATERSRQTYEENKKDYRYGLVTSLDVLIALNEYISTKRRFENTIIDLTALQLNLAAGETP